MWRTRRYFLPSCSRQNKDFIVKYITEAIPCIARYERREKMKAGELIAIVDNMKSNQIGEDVKFCWLDEVNARVLCEIVKTAPESIEKISCGEDELCVPSPYSRMYSEYLLAMLAFVGGEYDCYAKMYSAYEKTYLEYAKYCIRTR